MSVIILAPRDFTLVGRNSKTLNINLQGPVLVFFKQNSCRGCMSFAPIFNKFANIEKRIKYAIYDLDSDPSKMVVKKSQQSNTPITHVPFVIFYVDGKPSFVFNTRDKSEQATGTFIRDMIGKLPQNSFVPSHHQSHVYAPDIQQPKRQAPPGKYHKLGGDNDDQDDDSTLIIPENITPYNKPWESAYKRMGTLD